MLLALFSDVHSKVTVAAAYDILFCLLLIVNDTDIDFNEFLTWCLYRNGLSFCTGGGCSWWEGGEFFYNQWASNHQHPTVTARVPQTRVQAQP